MSIRDLRLSVWRFDRASARRSGPRRQRRGQLGLETLEVRLVPATSNWLGAGTNANWTTAANWDTPPVATNDLVFPSTTATNLTNDNNIGTGIAYGALLIQGANYAIGGDMASFSSVDASQTTGSSTVSLPIGLTSPATVGVDNAASTLIMQGIISGSAGLTKSGAGILHLTANNTYTGQTGINAGTVLVDGTQGSGPVNVASGATLGGIGTVSSISSTGGTVSPGDSAAGILTDSGAATFAAQGTTNSVFSVVIDGSTAGTGPNHYSQLQVDGTISLSAANLNVTLGPDFTPSVGSTYTIIDNTANTPVSGTFTGLPQGATLTVSGTTFEVIYNGGSNAESVVLQEVNTTTTTLSASPTSATFGQSVALTANVTGSSNTGTPTGVAEFFQGTALLGTVTLANGSATLNTTALPIGTNSVTAMYVGNADFAPSTSAASSITVGQASTSTAVTFSPSSPELGQSVTLTATITPTTTGPTAPTGSINFLDGTVVLGSGTVTNDQATFSTSTLAAGSHSITAEYTGDSNYTTSTSPATTVTITSVSTTTVVTYAPALPVFGEQVTLTATITPGSAFSPLPTGTVDFFNGSTLLGSGSVSNDVATLNTTALAVGNNSVTAQYLGDTNYSGSTSAVNLAAVVLAATTTTLSPLSNTRPAPFEKVTLTASVAIVSPAQER